MIEPRMNPDRDVRRTVFMTLLVVAAFVLALVVLGRPATGLPGYYGVRDAGAGVVPLLVDERGRPVPRIDPRIDFPFPQRLDAVYIYNWDIPRLGFPESMPPYAIAWRGVLRVPESGVHGFQLVARGEAQVRIDGRTLESLPGAAAERHLDAGLHPIEIDYAVTEGDARLRLLWRPPGEKKMQPVPGRYLGADADAFVRERTRAWSRTALVLLAIAAAIALVLPGSRRSVLAGRLLSGGPRLALGLILLLAALLRFHDYALVPFHHETADEYQHAWEGWNLLHEGTPASWSAFPDRYPQERVREFRWFGDPYALVWPYFDHPPLFSVLVGLVASIGAALRGGLPAGGPGYLLCTLPMMRLVPIALSLLGVVLVHRLARAYGAPERAALLGALCYATMPILVLGHRLVKAENLLAVLLMGAILLVERHKRTGRTADAVLAGLLCGLALWTKATGVAVIAIVVALMAAARRYRGAALASAIAAGIGLLYLGYAWLYDWSTFTAVIHAQATTKWASLDSFLDLLAGKVVVKPFGRGWYLFLLLAAAYAALRRPRALLVPVAIYVMILAMTADFRVVYGWYRLPIAPFLCIAAGFYLHEMLEKADLYRVFPFAATAVVTGLLYAFAIDPIATASVPGSARPVTISVAQTQAAVVLFSLFAIGPYLLRLVHDRDWTRRLARGVTWGLLAVFVVTCVSSVGGLVEIYARTSGLR